MQVFCYSLRAVAAYRDSSGMAPFSKRQRTPLCGTGNDGVVDVTKIVAIHNLTPNTPTSFNYARASPNSHQNDGRITANNSCPSFWCASHFSMHITGVNNGRFIISVCITLSFCVCALFLCVNNQRTLNKTVRCVCHVHPSAVDRSGIYVIAQSTSTINK